MSISVTCGACSTDFRVKDEYAGKRGRCPHCQAVVSVPAVDHAAETKVPAKSQRRALPSQQLVMQEILEAFQGDIPKPRTTVVYRVGILLLFVTLLVLPALYVALIANIAYFLFWHATENWTRIAQFRSPWAMIFLYVGPLIIGTVLLFFLVKPLFARRSRDCRLRTLTFGEEPLLFALVTRVAQAVGAPEPKRISLDCQANASASFGSGLGAFFGRDLVLTIGLPLAGSLTTQQLAGVIAHELGHFGQGTGMRLSYAVRSINAWFLRVVFERDDWDERLVRGCEAGDRFAIFLYLALLCVWLTRGVLWLLMAVGHILSCLMLRQMEYDADRYEIRLAGTKDFAETSRQIALLGLATNGALGLAAMSWKKNGQLPDDLSGLIVSLARGVPPKELSKIEKALEQTGTGFFDTHPAHRDRLASARQENAPGVFHLDGPATGLFKDFQRMSRELSLEFYRTAIDKRIKRESLIATGALLANQEAAKTRQVPVPFADK